MRHHPNEVLIGMPGGRTLLSTPALVLDLDALEHNIATMMTHCNQHRLQLRPHGKTHKSLNIARLQLQAGAIGICAATLGEAEAFAEGGISGVLLCAPIVSQSKLERLARLNARSTGLIAAVDHLEVVSCLGELVKASMTKPLKLLVDIDLGMGRTGLSDIESLVALARTIAAQPSLEFAGVQAYAGNLQHVVDYQERRAKVAAQLKFLNQIVQALIVAGLRPEIVSGGGTGTHNVDPEFGLFTELQAGSYIVMDVDYNRVQLREGVNTPPFETSIFVRTTVISAHHLGHATTDAGLKRFATDGPAPIIARGAPAGATYQFMGDEYGRIIYAEPGKHLRVGAQIECVTPHCDPTINLYDVYHVVRGDTLVDIWPIDARGAD